MSETNNNTDFVYDPKAAYEQYMYVVDHPTPEVIANYGGIENYRKAVRKFKREQNFLKFKSKAAVFWLDIRPIVFFLLIAYLIGYFFF